MASNSTRAIQDKLFRGALGLSDADPRDHRLTIEIPKLAASRPEAPPKVSKAGPHGDTIQTSYRQRLSEKLGVDYQGVERYRLQQDDARLRHWKRWGPYLSDRQWVSMA